jgi:hypothetical protein
MSKDRVAVNYRNSKMFVIVPHGHPTDDVGTSSIGDEIAKNIKSSSVINNGWKRDEKYNASKSQADMNYHPHLVASNDYTEAGKEFLEPIIFAQDVVEKYSYDGSFCGSLIVHGMTDANGPNSIILGIGLPDRLTISTGAAGLFAKILDKASNKKFKIYFGKPGGSYSARSLQNLCQVVSTYGNNSQDNDFSIQIELARTIRDDKAQRTKIIDAITVACDTLIKQIEADSINPLDKTEMASFLLI